MTRSMSCKAVPQPGKRLATPGPRRSSSHRAQPSWRGPVRLCVPPRPRCSTRFTTRLPPSLRPADSTLSSKLVARCRALSGCPVRRSMPPKGPIVTSLLRLSSIAISRRSGQTVLPTWSRREAAASLPQVWQWLCIYTGMTMSRCTMVRGLNGSRMRRRPKMMSPRCWRGLQGSRSRGLCGIRVDAVSGVCMLCVGHGAL